MAVGRSPDEEVSLYSQAVVSTGGETGSGESTSEGDFRGVGDEGVSAIAFLLIRVLIKVVNKG